MKMPRKFRMYAFERRDDLGPLNDGRFVHYEEVLTPDQPRLLMGTILLDKKYVGDSPAVFVAICPGRENKLCIEQYCGMEVPEPYPERDVTRLDMIDRALKEVLLVLSNKQPWRRMLGRMGMLAQHLATEGFDAGVRSERRQQHKADEMAVCPHTKREYLAHLGCNCKRCIQSEKFTNENKQRKQPTKRKASNE